MIDYLTISLFLVTFVGGLALGITAGVIMTIQPAAGQTPTPVITIPNPQSGLNFLPQKAYVTTLTPDGIPVQIPIAPQPVQQGDGTLQTVIPGLIAAALAYFGKKLIKFHFILKNNRWE